VDEVSLQERLLERQAKHEIGIIQNDKVAAILELETSPPNIAVAMGAGIFGVGWTTFTAIHYVFLI